MLITWVSRTIVPKRWITEVALSRESCRFASFTDKPRELPLANITLTVEDKTLDLEVAI